MSEELLEVRKKINGLTEEILDIEKSLSQYTRTVHKEHKKIISLDLPDSQSKLEWFHKKDELADWKNDLLGELKDKQGERARLKTDLLNMGEEPTRKVVDVLGEILDELKEIKKMLKK